MSEEPLVETTAVQSSVCQDCGGDLAHPGEYHPVAFCALVRAGFDPWQVVRIIAGQLSLGDPGEKPPVFVVTQATLSPPKTGSSSAVAPRETAG